MLNPDWRRLTSEYVQRQNTRDQKLGEISRLLSGLSGAATLTDALELLKRIRGILES